MQNIVTVYVWRRVPGIKMNEHRYRQESSRQLEDLTYLVPSRRRRGGIRRIHRLALTLTVDVCGSAAAISCCSRASDNSGTRPSTYAPSQNRGEAGRADGRDRVRSAVDARARRRRALRWSQTRTRLASDNGATAQRGQDGLGRQSMLVSSSVLGIAWGDAS